MDINYMNNKLKLPIGELKSEELEMTLVHKYMERNGWNFPAIGDSHEEYDMAVSDIKWFLNQLIDLSG